MCGTVLTMTKVPPRSVGSPLEQGDGKRANINHGMPAALFELQLEFGLALALALARSLVLALAFGLRLRLRR